MKPMPKHKNSESEIATDHETIKRWAEARGGRPGAVAATHRRKDAGILRIIFPDSPYADDDKLEEISWDEFFRKFDEAGLALLYQEETAGGKKRLFNKLVSRDTAEAGRKH
jgi:hypothetical protein